MFWGLALRGLKVSDGHVTTPRGEQGERNEIVGSCDPCQVFPRPQHSKLLNFPVFSDCHLKVRKLDFQQNGKTKLEGARMSVYLIGNELRQIVVQFKMEWLGRKKEKCDGKYRDTKSQR